jgi:dihydrofolate synthase / folylpolyglutamate synthase
MGKQMNCDETIAYIDSLAPTLEHPSLTRIQNFLAESGNQQNQLNILHVGGTNGKGSTVAMLDSILRASGAKIGRFTGPHLLRWHERFHLNGAPISDQDFARIGTDIREKSEDFGRRHPELGALTWFEFLTALAISYFSEEEVDVAILEVGLGGRFDATNAVAEPLCCGITNISLDHTQILGDTVEQIAFEKAGIIKSGVPIVTSAQGSALEVIARQAKEMDAPLTIIRSRSGALGGEQDSDTAYGIDPALLQYLSLRGPHQKTNASLAIEMLIQSGLYNLRGSKAIRRPPARLNGLVTEQSIKNGLRDVYWPGRFQLVDELGLILDGAHNLDGIKALRQSLNVLFPDQNFQFLFGCYGNKNGSAMLELLVRPGDSVILTEASSKRTTFDKAALAAEAQKLGISYSVAGNVAEPMSAIVKRKKSSQMTVVTGSFAMLKDVAIALGWHTVEDGSPDSKVAID